MLRLSLLLSCPAQAVTDSVLQEGQEKGCLDWASAPTPDGCPGHSPPKPLPRRSAFASGYCPGRCRIYKVPGASPGQPAAGGPRLETAGYETASWDTYTGNSGAVFADEKQRAQLARVCFLAVGKCGAPPRSFPPLPPLPLVPRV